MILPSNRVRIVVATKPIDFRKGRDGLAALVKNELRKEPFTGTVFVFRARRADRLKLLYWDGTGLVMTCKRLEETTFTWPAIRDTRHRIRRTSLLGVRENTPFTGFAHQSPLEWLFAELSVGGHALVSHQDGAGR